MPALNDETLDGFTTSQLGELGEETAREYFEERDVPIVDMDDGVREQGRRGLDLTIVLDGEYMACEVKTRWRDRSAGRLRRDGNLPRARLRRRRSRLDGVPSYPQASEQYVLQRVSDDIEVFEDTIVAAVLLIVDLRARLAQLYLLEHGRVGDPIGSPEDCTTALEAAFATLYS